MSAPALGPLPWDGSDLGPLPGGAVAARATVDGAELWRLANGDYCYARRGGSAAAVVDELKPLFGLPKNGTHRFAVGRAAFVATRVPGAAAADWEPPLALLAPGHPLRQAPAFREGVKLFLAFRDLVGLAPTERALVVREGPPGEFFPASVGEGEPGPAAPAPAPAVLAAWFADESLADAARRLCGAGPPETLAATFQRVRAAARAVAHRVDPDALGIAEDFAARLQLRLQQVSAAYVDAAIASGVPYR